MSGVICMVCPNCGLHVYPPSEVSAVGVEEYEEVYPAPPLTPKTPPTEEDLYVLDKKTGERKRLYPSIDDFLKEYATWAKSLREQVLSEARRRFEELKGKLRDLELVEEDEAFRVRGRRFKAEYVKSPVGWTLKCPNCGQTLITFTKY